MTGYLVLLRGVNLGSHHRIAMADLRTLLAGLGYTDVRTLLQSGNALLTGPDDAHEDVRARVEEALEREFGAAVPCVVRDGPDLRRVVDANPLAGIATDGSKYLVTFLSAAPPPDLLDAVPPDAPERYALGAREFYTWYPNGVSKAAPTTPAFRRRLAGLSGTARNWNTVTKLLAMMD